MEGCPEFSPLCDVSRFVNRVAPFATRKNRGCGVEESNSSTNDVSPGPSFSSTFTPRTVASRDESLLLILSMVASFVVGSVLTCTVMQCCRWRPRTKQRDESELVSMGKESTVDFMEEAKIVID